MKIFIATVGTRGDVQPYLALGKGLLAAGHEVMICAPATFESFITAHGLQYGYMNSDILKLIDTDSGREALEQSGGKLAQLKSYADLYKQVKPIQARMAAEAGQAAAQFGPELVIAHPKAMVGSHLAEKHAVPYVMSLPLPLLTPTAEFPALLFPKLPLGAGYNRWTYNLSIKLAWMQYRDVVNAWRVRDLGLAPAPKKFNEMVMANGQPTPTLYPYSEHLLPRPTDWPATTVVPGYWFLEREADWRPSAELEAFLAAGPPPVYIGFGSMAGKDSAKKAQIALEAGTTAAGLRAGKPTIICPFMADQPFWGRRVAALGVGSDPIPQKKLTAAKPSAAIEQVTRDEGIQQRAQAIGHKIRAEDGVGTAAAFLERLVVIH